MQMMQSFLPLSKKKPNKKQKTNPKSTQKESNLIISYIPLKYLIKKNNELDVY